MFIAVGKVSFDDCDMFTWSFGWTGVFVPISPPQISMARLEITSFTFMFVCVPEPVCQTNSGKWSSSLPAMTSSAACDDRVAASRRGIFPRSQFTSAAAFLSTAIARITAVGHAVVGDREVVQRPLGLRAPVPVAGHEDLAHAVALDACVRWLASVRSWPERYRGTANYGAIQDRHDLDVARVREQIDRRGAREGVAAGLQQADVAAERRRVARDEHDARGVGGDDVLHDVGAEPGPGRVRDHDVGRHRLPPGDVGAARPSRCRPRGCGGRP